MTRQSVPANDTVTVHDLRVLARAQAPCITIGIPVPTPEGYQPKESLVDELEVESLLAPFHDVLVTAETERLWHEWFQVRPLLSALTREAVGSIRGVLFGTSTDRDRQERYLARFLSRSIRA